MNYLSTSFCLGAGLKRQGHWFLYHRVSKNGVPGAFVFTLKALSCHAPSCSWWNFSCLCCRVAYQAAAQDIEAGPQERFSAYLCFLVRSCLLVFHVFSRSFCFECCSLTVFHLASFVGMADFFLFETKRKRKHRHSESCLVESMIASQAVTLRRIKNQRFDGEVLIHFWAFGTKGSASLVVICTLERIATLSNYEPPLKVSTETSEEREASSSNSCSTLGLGHETSMFDFQAWLSQSHNNCRTYSQSSQYQTTHCLQQDSMGSRPDRAWCSNTLTRTRADWNREQTNEKCQKGYEKVWKRCDRDRPHSFLPPIVPTTLLKVGHRKCCRLSRSKI